MSTSADPTQPEAATDFDATRPVRFYWRGQRIEVFRQRTDGVLPRPHLMLLIGESPTGHAVRPCLPSDTRDVVAIVALNWLDQETQAGRLTLPMR